MQNKVHQVASEHQEVKTNKSNLFKSNMTWRDASKFLAAWGALVTLGLGFTYLNEYTTRLAELKQAQLIEIRQGCMKAYQDNALCDQMVEEYTRPQ